MDSYTCHQKVYMCSCIYSLRSSNSSKQIVFATRDVRAKCTQKRLRGVIRERAPRSATSGDKADRISLVLFSVFWLFCPPAPSSPRARSLSPNVILAHLFIIRLRVKENNEFESRNRDTHIGKTQQCWRYRCHRGEPSAYPDAARSCDRLHELYGNHYSAFPK